MDTTTTDDISSSGGHEITTLESGYDSMSPASTRSPRNADMEDSPEMDTNRVVSGIEDKPSPNLLPKKGKKFPVLVQPKKKIRQVTPVPEKDDLSSEDELPLSQRLLNKSSSPKKKSLTKGKANQVRAFRQKQSKFDREILSEMKNPKASTSGPLLREIERNRRRLIAKAKADAEGSVFIDSDFVGTPSPRQIQHTRSNYGNYRSSGLNTTITPRRKSVIKTSMSPEERRNLLKRKSPEKSIFARRSTSTYGNKRHLPEKREKFDTDHDDQEFQSLESALKKAYPVATAKKGLKPNKENKPTNDNKKPGAVVTKISNQNQIVNGQAKQLAKVNSNNKIKKPEIIALKVEEEEKSSNTSTLLLGPELSSDPKKSIEFINKTYPEIRIEIINISDESLKNNESPSNKSLQIMNRTPQIVLERLDNLSIPKSTTDSQASHSLLEKTRQKDFTTTNKAQKRRQKKVNNKEIKEEERPTPALTNSASTNGKTASRQQKTSTTKAQKRPQKKNNDKEVNEEKRPTPVLTNFVSTNGETVSSEQQQKITTTKAQKRPQKKNNDKKVKVEKSPPSASVNSVSSTTATIISPSRILVLKLKRLSEAEIKKMSKSSTSSDRGENKQANNKKKSVGTVDDNVATATLRLSAHRKRNPKHGNDNFLFYN